LIEDLLRKSDDLEALAMFRGAMKAQVIDAEQRANQRAPGSRGRGRPLDLYNNGSDVQVYRAPTGNSTAAVLRRLEKDRPDIHARVLNGEISGYAGMVEAGFRKRDATGGRSSPYDKIMRLIVDLDTAELGKLRDWIDMKLDEQERATLAAVAQTNDIEPSMSMKTADLTRLHALAAQVLARTDDNPDKAARELAATLADDANRPLLVAVVLEFLARRPQG
jgi:hypothetical protein